MFDPRDCARQIMEVVPAAMRSIRAEMRRQCENQLSVPQFRTMAYLHRQPGASLAAVAEHIGVTPPAMSRMVDRLVERGLVARQSHPDSRRQLTLALTPHGAAMFEAARARTHDRIAGMLGTLAAEDLASIESALTLLARVFVKGGS
ncbi:MAG: MarR family transcriptional regulator [Firmicutes bacterium]|nr:MarR family transcriptional regulator [Bacillota bacterium]